MKVHEDEKIINRLANKFNEEKRDEIFDKIGSYLIDKCYNSFSLKVARKHFNGALYINEINEEKFQDYKAYYAVDYSIFKTEDDFIQTENEIELIYKFHKALDIHNKRQDEIEAKGQKEEEKEDREDIEAEEKLETFGLDLPTIPKYIKGSIFVIVLSLVFGGTLYYVNSIINKPKKNKKRDKKKKKKNE